MKKLIRILLKIPATPFVLSFFVLAYVTLNIVRFFEWVYEASEWNKHATRECTQDIVDLFKRWFTTI